MKDGEIVEQGTTEQLFHHGSHPYTRELVGETLKIMGEDNNA
jgi:ABC-type dipeptide/oligopeptide/nickel transport system ATPase component